jgi:hypothetical protein
MARRPFRIKRKAVRRFLLFALGLTILAVGWMTASATAAAL